MKMPPVLCCIVFLFVSMLSAVARQQEKPRVIVTTDGEIDDQSSMIRFLMYSSDYDVAGIVQVNGVQKDGHSKDKWIESQIAKYAECLPNLRKHNPDYPDAEYLLSVLAVGNENREDLHKLPPLLSDSEGAQLIIRTLLDSDPRPVHILAWGGPTPRPMPYGRSSRNILLQNGQKRYQKPDYIVFGIRTAVENG
jgi:hypothetical protein